MATKLTDAEVDRIDLLYNETHEYLTRILAGHYAGDWDMDLIDCVIEAVWEHIKDKGWMTDREFYPYEESEA